MATRMATLERIFNPSWMQLILFLYLKTTRMKINWKRVALYVLRVLELIVTGAAGGVVSQL